MLLVVCKSLLGSLEVPIAGRVSLDTKGLRTAAINGFKFVIAFKNCAFIYIYIVDVETMKCSAQSF